MMPTFLIALREGVEASLIVGILAAFLVKKGRADALRWMWTGVAVAVVVCLGIGVGLEILNATLPQKQQEGLESIVAIVAVGFVTYMIVWMKRHARELKGTLERHAGEAVAAGSTGALVAMAFFAVLREGFETAVFLVATFQSSANTAAAVSGAVVGLGIAILIGALFYRGGARINLAKFFRLTSALLVIVAAGLVASAFHTAHEAGWLNTLQSQAFDMSWLVRPGSVRFALLNGMFGLQARPVLAEVGGWLLYLIPVMAYVLWPTTRIQRIQQPAAV